MRLILSAAAMIGAACTPLVAQAPILDQWRTIAVEFEPVTFPEARVGALLFRGGLEMRSEDPEFGGFSGLEVLDDGRLIAISDAADWFEARLVLDEDGVLVGVTDMRSTSMRDETGAVFASKDAGDSEDIAQLPDGRFAVSFEQTQSIRLYDLNRDGPFGAAAPGPVLADVARLPGNVGLEAIASAANGDLVIGAEGNGGVTPIWRARLDAQAQTPVSAHYPLPGGYSLTSLDRLPDGGFVALERFYAPVIGARARITRFAEDASTEDAVIEPEELARLAPPMPVDNFEGISAVRMPDGATRLYIVSDDNFSDRQRTLLLAFDIAAP